MTNPNDDALVENVALAMSKVEWCGAVADGKLCLCNDLRLPEDIRQEACLCWMKAPAAIAVLRPVIRAEALREAATMVKNGGRWNDWGMYKNMQVAETVAQEISEDILALIDKEKECRI